MNKLPASSAISLEQLEKLQRNSPTTTPTSPSQLIEIPSSESSGKPVVSLILPKKTSNPLDAFEASIGGRDSLIDTLELSTLDRREQHFLDLLCDPKRSNDSITHIAKDAGLKPLKVLELFRSASFAKAHAIAMGQLSNSLPAVVDDITAKSVDAKIECPLCYGAGKTNAGEVCPQCDGKGTIMRYSDLDRQKIVLETVGLTKKGGGVNVQVNQQVGIAPGNYFSKWVKDSDSTANEVIDITPSEEPKDG